MAAKLLQFPTEYGEVLIAAAVPEAMVQPTGRLEDSIEVMEKSLSEALRLVAAICKSFRDVIDEASADTAELELGLQFTAKGSIYVVETQGNASLKIKMSFKPKT